MKIHFVIGEAYDAYFETLDIKKRFNAIKEKLDVNNQEVEEIVCQFYDLWLETSKAQVRRRIF